jgi:hypothetical protein
MRSIFAVVAIGIVALMTIALLLLLMHRHPCRQQYGVISLVTMASLPFIRNGVVTLVVIALLPSSSWRCCPYHNGIVVIIINVIVLVTRQQARIAAVNAQASFLFVAMAILALVMMASLPLLMHRRISAVVKLALLPWPHVIKLVLLPTL